jgi:hypothetical protein
MKDHSADGRDGSRARRMQSSLGESPVLAISVIDVLHVEFDRAEVFAINSCLAVRVAQNCFSVLAAGIVRLQGQDFYEEDKNARGNQVIGYGETSALAI